MINLIKFENTLKHKKARAVEGGHQIKREQ